MVKAAQAMDFSDEIGLPLMRGKRGSIPRQTTSATAHCRNDRNGMRGPNRAGEMHMDVDMMAEYKAWQDAENKRDLDKLTRPRVLVVFGSALTSDSPRDIDVACEGEFGERECAIVAQWARERGLAGLPVDVSIVRPWRGVDDSADATLTLPCAHIARGQHFVLRGKVNVTHYVATALPALIRASESTEGLLRILRDPMSVRGDSRMAILAPITQNEGKDFDSYVQGRLALHNAIKKCPFWATAELQDPRLQFLCMFAALGVVPTVRAEIHSDSQTGGGDNGVSWVTLDGIRLSYGRLIPWAEALPAKRIRRIMARQYGRRDPRNVCGVPALAEMAHAWQPRAPRWKPNGFSVPGC